MGLRIGVLLDEGLVVGLVGRGEMNGERRPERRRHGVLDELTELLVHPLEMEFTRCGEDDRVVTDLLDLQSVEPCPPRDRGHPSTQRLPKLFPALGCEMRFHLVLRQSPRTSNSRSPQEYPHCGQRPCDPVVLPVDGPRGAPPPEVGSERMMHPVASEYMDPVPTASRTANPRVAAGPVAKRDRQKPCSHKGCGGMWGARDPAVSRRLRPKTP